MSEGSRRQRSAVEFDLTVDPREIQSFIRAARDSAPNHFRGFVWFRLPLVNDQRVFSRDAIEKMSTDRVPEEGVIALFRKVEGNGQNMDVIFENRAGLPMPTPSLIRVPPGCRPAYVKLPFREHAGVLNVDARIMLKPGEEYQLGWFYCI